MAFVQLALWLHKEHGLVNWFLAQSADNVSALLVQMDDIDDFNDHASESRGRSFFEMGSLHYAQRNFRGALRHCSRERVNGCTQLLVFVNLLLGEYDDVAQQNLEETTLDILHRMVKHVCIFEPSECARLLSDAVCLARVDPLIVKTLQEVRKIFWKQGGT